MKKGHAHACPFPFELTKSLSSYIPPPRGIVDVLARVPLPIGSAVVVEVPDIKADSRVVEVVVVVVSGVEQEVSTSAKSATAGARMVSFFIFGL